MLQSQSGPLAKRPSSKVRTGCSTCKSRHVKCDETKPICLRCLKSGTSCAGYHAPKPWLFQPDESRKERRAFHFLLTVSTHALEVANDEDFYFWNCLVLQGSHHFEATRCALTSISAYHESLVDSVNASDHRQHAQRQYKKAIRLLSMTLDSCGEAPISNLLMTCLILRCLEVYQNSYQNAQLHLQGGISILRCAEESRNPPRAIDSVIVLLYDRLAQNCTMVPELKPMIAKPSHDFATSREARDRLHEILAGICASFINEGPSHPANDGALSVVQRDLYLLTHWFMRFQMLLQKKQKLSHNDLCSTLYTRIQYQLARIMLSIVHSTSETILDSQTNTFRGLLESCQDFANVRTGIADDDPEERTRRPPVRLGFGLEIILTIFFIATRCRDPGIRRSAIAFLKGCYRRELRWDSFHAARIAEWVVKTEESFTKVRAAEDISDSRRMRILNISYYHIQEHNSGTSAQFDTFQRPAWAKVEYELDSSLAKVFEHWIELDDHNGSSESSTPYGYGHKLLLSYQTDAPFLPSTALRLFLAYQEGVQTHVPVSISGCDKPYDNSHKAVDSSDPGTVNEFL